MADPSGTVIGSVEVEIRARMDALEKDLQQAQARFQKFNDDQRKTASATNVMQKEFAVVERQMIALAGGLGLVGTAMSSLGTYGLVAAAGLGVMDKAFSDTVESARKFGQSVQDLFNLSASTGFAIGDIKALKNAAEELGLSGEHVNMWLMRFNMALGDVRRGGTGPLYDALAKLDQGLVVAVQDSKSNAEAFDLVAKAALNAGTNADMFYRALGRGGQQAAPLFSKIVDSGGLQKYVEANKKNALMSEEELDARRKIEGSIKNSLSDAEAFWNLSAARSRGILSGGDTQTQIKQAAEQFKALSMIGARAFEGENWLALWIRKQVAQVTTSDWLPEFMRNAAVDAQKVIAMRTGKVTESQAEMSPTAKGIYDSLNKMRQEREEQENKDRLEEIRKREQFMDENPTRLRTPAAQGELNRLRSENVNKIFGGKQFSDMGNTDDWAKWLEQMDKAGPAVQAAAGAIDAASAATKKLNDELVDTKRRSEDAAVQFTNFSTAMKVLGAGATIAEQYRLAQLSLNAELTKSSNALGVQMLNMRENKILTADEITARKEEIDKLQSETVERIKNANAMATQTQSLNTLRAIMGGAAPQGLADAIKLLDINQQIAKLKDQAGKTVGEVKIPDIAALERYRDIQIQMARETALGVTAVKQQAQSILLDMQTMGMAVGPATETKVIQEALNKAWMESGGNLDIYKQKVEELMKVLPQYASLLGSLRTEQERMKVNSDIMRERQTMFLSDEDARIAEKLKGLYPDITTAINSAEAAQMRFNDRLKEATGWATDFNKTWINALVQGKGAGEAFRQAFAGLGQSMLNKGIEGMTKQMMGGLFGGNSELGKLFGAGSLDTKGTLANPMIVKNVDAITGSLGQPGGTGIPGMPSSGMASVPSSGAPNIYGQPNVLGSGTQPQDVNVASWGDKSVSTAVAGDITGGATIPPHIANDPQAMAALNQLATNQGVSPAAAAMVINTESGWKTGATTGSYTGFSQIGTGDLAKMGYTRESFAQAPPSAQIGAYDQWLTNYNFKDKMTTAGIDPSSMTVPQQAALLQGTQFGPNRTQLFGQIGQGQGWNTPFTTTPQAGALGSTSMNDMTKYYEGVYAKNPGQFSGNNMASFDESGMISGNNQPIPVTLTTPQGSPLSGPGASSFDEAGMFSGSQGGTSLLATGADPTASFTKALESAAPKVTNFGDVSGVAGTNVSTLGSSVSQTATTIPTMTANMDAAALSASAKAAADQTGAAAAGGKAVSDEAGAVASGAAAAGNTTEAAASLEAAAADTVEAGASSANSLGGSVGLLALLAMKDGGPVRRYAPGGEITGAGGPRDDKVPIMASPGEFIVNAASTRKYRRQLEAINAGTAPAESMMMGTHSAAAKTIAPEATFPASLMQWNARADGGFIPMFSVPRYADGGMIPGMMKQVANTVQQNAPNSPSAQANARARGETSGTSVRIVNAFDSAGFLQEALQSREGEQTILNFVRANQHVFRKALE